MNVEKCIEILNNLSCYIDESWDRSDPEIIKQIDENIKALEFAVSVLDKSNVVGSLEIQGKQYLVSD